MIRHPFITTGMQVLMLQEKFWQLTPPADLRQILKYSCFLGFFPFAGYLFSYTVRGKIWNIWPFIHTTLDVPSAIVFAGMQWILFSIFPLLSSLIIEMVTSRSNQRVDFYDGANVIAYSMTPLCLSVLFVGVPYFDRVLNTIGFATFLFLLYYGFRSAFAFTMMRSVWVTFLIFVLFALIREMFVFAIGY